MRSSFIPRQRVDFIDNDRLHAAQHFAAFDTDRADRLRLVTGVEGRLPKFGEWNFQVAVNIVGKRSQRRDVHHAHPVDEPAIQCLAQQSIQAKQKRRERFAAACRGGNERVASGGNFRPTQPLRLGRLAKPLAEPGFN